MAFVTCVMRCSCTTAWRYSRRLHQLLLVAFTAQGMLIVVVVVLIHSSVMNSTVCFGIRVFLMLWSPQLRVPSVSTLPAYNANDPEFSTLLSQFAMMVSNKAYSYLDLSEFEPKVGELLAGPPTTLVPVFNLDTEERIMNVVTDATSASYLISDKVLRT